MKLAETEEAATLLKHMIGTYFNLRLGISAIGFALPLVLWLGGKFWNNEPLQPSISAYYHMPTMGDWFVGFVVAIGVFSFLYKGFDKREDRALNLAGLCAIVVAFVPTSENGVSTQSSSVHGVFAVLFFVFIAYVCIFRKSDTLKYIDDDQKRKWFKITFIVLGIAMVFLPLAAGGLAIVLAIIQEGGTQGQSLFRVETAALWVFAAYWLVKTVEIWKYSDAEHGTLLKGSPERRS